MDLVDFDEISVIGAQINPLIFNGDRNGQAKAIQAFS
jgi:hypothetical protein